MGSRDQFELRTQRLGALPVVNWFCDRLGLDELFERFVPANDRRLRLAPAAALGVVVRNLVIDHEPIYALSEWVRPYDPALLGLSAHEVDLLNDDRVGRGLDRLFDTDRASLLTELVLRAVRAFDIDCTQLHNDSTTVTFSGDYSDADGRPRGGKPTAAITFGHNKDHRPDLKQLVWILTVTADGAVPLAHRVASGNVTDDTTHIGTWDDLVALVGRKDFLYVADSKLCCRATMDHISAAGGRFVTVLPRTRREDAWFRDWLCRNTPDWVEATRTKARRRDQPDDVLSVFESPLGSVDGHRIIWVRSTAKRTRDAAARAARIERATSRLDDLARRLAGPKCRLKTRATVQQAAEAILNDTDTSRYFELQITEGRDKTYTAEHRGNPGPNTRFRQNTRPRFTLSWRQRHHAVRDEAASDGCFPLITNDPDLPPAEVLAAYRYQPHLERRHHCLKGAQAVAPMNLHSPARIEALLCCHFIALLIHALIERQIRNAMTASGSHAIALYPEDRNCTAPSAARTLKILGGLQRHQLHRHGRTIQVFNPDLDALQRQVLKLLDVPTRLYRQP